MEHDILRPNARSFKLQLLGDTIESESRMMIEKLWTGRELRGRVVAASHLGRGIFRRQASYFSGRRSAANIALAREGTSAALL